MNNFTYDKESDCAYVYLTQSREHPIRTEPINENVIIDYDGHGHVIGVEILGLKELIKNEPK